jgi:hypothetical protein
MGWGGVAVGLGVDCAKSWAVARQKINVNKEILAIFLPDRYAGTGIIFIKY